MEVSHGKTEGSLCENDNKCNRLKLYFWSSGYHNSCTCGCLALHLGYLRGALSILAAERRVSTGFL